MISKYAKTVILIMLALSISACSITVPVAGKTSDDSTLYVGTATGYMDRTGTLNMINPKGDKCEGDFVYTAPRAGHGALKCTNGRSANFDFIGTSATSGYGFGKTADGVTVSFYFGMPSSIGEKFLYGSGQSATGNISSSSSGTGFFVTSSGHIITNNHVIDSATNIKVRDSIGNVYQASVVAADTMNDIALLKIESLTTKALRFSRSNNIRQGESCAAYGFPYSEILSSQGNLSTGIVSAVSGLGNDTRYLQITCPVQAGNSGSPLTDSKGSVIGVVTSKISDMKILKAKGELPQNINFAIKSSTIKAFLETHGIDYSQFQPTQQIEMTALATLLRESTVHIFAK